MISLKNSYCMNLFNSMHSGININNIEYGVVISNPSTCTINTVTDTNGDIYKVYSFTSGTNSMKINLSISTPFYYLCCAGGGVGGADAGGGGGGGGYLDGTLNLMSDTVNINVGTKGYWTDTNGATSLKDITNPGDSVITGLTFSEIRSIKGGAGGSYAFAGSSGGSGGGARPRTTTGYDGTDGQGYAGGNNGGGGAGGVGNASVGSTRGGAGGDGKLCSKNGIKLLYPTTKFCAGGAGGGGTQVAAGGTTGGGSSSITGKGGNAASWGSGGGGAKRGSGYVGGNGYSGIIVFAYKIS